MKFTKTIKKGDEKITLSLEKEIGQNLEEMQEHFDPQSIYDLAVAKFIIVCQTAVGTAYAEAVEKGEDFTQEDAQAVVDDVEYKYRRGKKADPKAKAKNFLSKLSPEERRALLEDLENEDEE